MKNKIPFFRTGKSIDWCQEYFGESAEEVIKQETSIVIQDDVLTPQEQRNRTKHRRWLEQQAGPAIERLRYWKKKGMPKNIDY